MCGRLTATRAYDARRNAMPNSVAAYTTKA
jgi:hypothetical protein